MWIKNFKLSFIEISGQKLCQKKSLRGLLNKMVEVNTNAQVADRRYIEIFYKKEDTNDPPGNFIECSSVQ